MENTKPKISFGIIVLNGMPFISHNLRAIYPFAHEILIVEGAYSASKDSATPEGHSIDNTLEELERFQKEEDPRKIIKIITKDGLWDGLTEQCQAWTEKVTGDFIWAIDIDEFYRPEDMQTIVSMLAKDPSITMMSFKLIQFCFNFDYTIHSGRDFFRHGIMECRRIFKFEPGYKYIQHEPPTVINEKGVDLKNIRYIDNQKTSALGIYIYHYTAIFKNQIELKAKAYSKRGWKGKSEHALKFLKNWISLENPFHLGWEYKYFTWIEKFESSHPPEILKLKQDIMDKKIPFELRDDYDIKKLLHLRSYKIKRCFCKIYERMRVAISEVVLCTRSILRNVVRPN